MVFKLFREWYCPTMGEVGVGVEASPVAKTCCLVLNKVIFGGSILLVLSPPCCKQFFAIQPIHLTNTWMPLALAKQEWAPILLGTYRLVKQALCSHWFTLKWFLQIFCSVYLKLFDSPSMRQTDNNFQLEGTSHLLRFATQVTGQALRKFARN